MIPTEKEFESTTISIKGPPERCATGIKPDDFWVDLFSIFKKQRVKK